MMWGDRGTPERKRAHEIGVAEVLVRSRELTPVLLEPRDPDHPDIHLDLGHEIVDLEIVAAVPHGPVTKAKAQERFDNVLRDEVAHLSPEEGSRFREFFGGCSITTHFRPMPPRTNERSHALALLRYLLEHPGVEEMEFDPTWRKPRPLMPWTPPVPHLEHLGVARLESSDEVYVGLTSVVVWDEFEVIRDVLRKKRGKVAGYDPCGSLELAVSVSSLPPEYHLARLREEFESVLTDVGYRAVWFVTDHESVLLGSPA